MKRIISLVLVFLMTFSFLPLLTSCAPKEVYITRAKWITDLAMGFGLDNYAQKEAYFKDVAAEDEIFDYVQSSVEWNVLDPAENKFNPKKIATNDFAFETALKAADVDIGELSAVEYAKKDGFISDNGYFTVRGKLTDEFAQTIIEWTISKYVNAEKEEYENVVLNDSLVDISKTNTAISAIGENTYTVSGSDADNINKDSVVLLPGDSFNPDGIAVKVKEKTENPDGSFTITVVEPELGDMYQELEFCKKVVPDMSMAILAPGVQMSSSSSSSADGVGKNGKALADYIPASEKNGAENTEKGLDVSFNINFTKGTISLNPVLNEIKGKGTNLSVSGEEAYTVRSGLTPDAGTIFEKESVIPDKNLIGPDPYDNTAAIEAYKNGSMSLDEFKKQLNLTETQEEKNVSSMTNKFSGGYEITGSLSLKNLYVTPEIKCSKFLGIPTGIDSMSVTVNYGCEANLSVKGKLEETLTVATIPIPVGATGISLTLELKLFAKLNGSIGVTASITNNTKYEYSHGVNKKTCEKSQSFSADASAKLDFGPNITVTVRFLGVAIVDLGIDVAVRLKAGIGLKYLTTYSDDTENITIKRNIVFSRKVNCYIPIISLNVGSKGTLANKLKLSCSFELCGEDKAYHKEIFNKENVIWEEEQVIKLREEEETTETDPDDANDDQKQMGEYLSIDKYYVFLSPGDNIGISVTTIPSAYDMDSLVWTSSDSAVATVSSGNVVAVKNGSVIISVKTPDGVYEAQCSVTVEDESVSFTPLEGVSASYDI